MPLDLASVIRPTPSDGPGHFTLDVPEGMRQGRGAWGGVSTGSMVAAAQLSHPRPGLTVRTLAAQLVAPVPVGRVLLEVEVLRRGSGTDTRAVRMRDTDGTLLSHGVVVLGAARVGAGMPDGDEWTGLEPPVELAAGPDAAPELGVPAGAPEFVVHLQMRPVTGPIFRGATGGVSAGWVRPRGPVSRVDAPLVAALADAWWVAVIERLDRPRPVATVGFTLDLPTDPGTLPRTSDGGLESMFHRGRVIAARDGYTVETRELWTADGRLVSWNTQTVAVIK